MSRRLLYALLTGRFSTPPIVQDDVESFFWVLVYCVYRTLMASEAGTLEEHEYLKCAFRAAFGRRLVLKIYDARGSTTTISHLMRSSLANDLTPFHLRMLLRQFNFAVRLEEERAYGITYTVQWEKPPLLDVRKAFTHQSILNAFKTITRELHDHPKLDLPFGRASVA